MDILWKAELGTCPPDGADDRKGQHLDEYTLIMNQVIHTFIRNNTLQKQILSLIHIFLKDAKNIHTKG